MKNYLLLLAVSCLISCKQSNTSIIENEILWDTYGVPHIYATNDANLYEMAGWAQMENHGNLILKLYGESRGVSAALWGEGFEVNKDMHELGVIDNAASNFEQLDTNIQEIISAFVKGVNAYANKNKERLNKDYLKILPVKETDIIIHMFRVINYEFLIKLMTSPNERKAGSNAWALSSKKTATGNAMLVANPHLWWSDLFLWQEQQLVTDEYSIYGATLLGIPTSIIGFNKDISWTHTVNPMDNTDFFEVKKKNNTYYLDGEYLPFEERTYTVKELKDDGTTEEHQFTQKKTKHGVVVKEFDDKVIAIRFAQMNDYVPYFEQYHLMGKAKNLDEFKDALSLQQMPFLNTLYADNAGNIMHHFGGLIPIKNGDWDKWQDVVSGDSSADIWTEYYASDELPTVINPPSGWLHNSNEPPFLNTLPQILNSEDFASHITPNITSLPFRPQRSARLLHEEENISFDRLIELKHDNKAEFALRIQDDISRLKEITSDSLTIAAINTLTKWDASYDSNSMGAIFFLEFINTWNNKIRIIPSLKEKWNVENPLKTPDGFNDQPEMIKILKTAAQNHLAKYPALEIPYGDYYKLKIGDKEYPATGGLQSIGVFRILSAVPDPNNENEFIGNFGDTFVLVVEMGDEIKAKGLLSYGNSSNPDSPYYGDQLELFSKNELRDIWITRADQEQHISKIENKNDM